MVMQFYSPLDGLLEAPRSPTAIVISSDRSARCSLFISELYAFCFDFVFRPTWTAEIVLECM